MTKESKIHYTKPSITDLEVEYAVDAARHGWGDRCYEYIEKFEKLFSEFTGTKYAIASSSCTGALHMGMDALGIGPGDEVIMGDANWIASAAPVTYLGAKPVFVDILPDSWCLDPVKVEAAITERTSAILAVHLYGNLCDMDSLLSIGEKHDVPVIEDAAEALGSRYKGRHAGTMGAFGAFSFHGTKTLTTGEGGMFFTSDPYLYEKVLTLSNHGRSRHQTKQFWPDVVGYKYKMSNIQAAIGCAQMERIDELVSRKRQIFDYYATALQSVPGISMNPESEDCTNSYWMPTVVFDENMAIDREALLEACKHRNIDARVFFWPLSGLDMFESVPDNSCAENICSRAINLPAFHDITTEQMERVVSIILDFLN